MTAPLLHTRRAESFFIGDRKLVEAAIPPNPAWSPPPRGQAIIADGAAVIGAPGRKAPLPPSVSSLPLQ